MMLRTTIPPTIEQYFQAEGIQPLLSNRQNIDTVYAAGVAHTKRFLERWVADPHFRTDMHVDHYRASYQYHLQADPEEIRLLWDEEAQKVHNPQNPVPLAKKRYQAFLYEKRCYQQAIRTGASPSNLFFRIWRERQIQHGFSKFDLARAQGVVHAPFCVEPSKGCSVGRWFCSFAAPRLQDIFSYTKKIAQLWQDVLNVLAEFTSPAARFGLCYWASDPFDNPDYEQFLIDFHAACGRLPQTTTALAMLDPQRTRNLLHLSVQKDGEIERFSLLTLEMLDRVHREFCAEELLFVESVSHHEGAITGMAAVGRAREKRFRQRLTSHNRFFPSNITATIACVSGFLLNMVDQSVQLISSCNTSDRWPLGYRIYADARFGTASELRSSLEQMLSIHMRLPPDVHDQAGSHLI